MHGGDRDAEPDVHPAARRPSETSCPAKSSVRSSRPPPRTSRVTSLPSARQAVAISTATTPPPTTASRPGTSCAEVASRLVHTRAPASPGRSGRAARVPVHTATACRAVRVRRPPPGVSTVTRRSPSSRPCPRTRSIPAEASHSTCPRRASARRTRPGAPAPPPRPAAPRRPPGCPPPAGRRRAQRLARHARPVRALAAHQFALHQGHAQPPGARPVRQVLPGRSAPDHHQVVVVTPAALGTHPRPPALSDSPAAR